MVLFMTKNLTVSLRISTPEVFLQRFNRCLESFKNSYVDLGYPKQFPMGSVVCFTYGVPIDLTSFNFVLIHQYRPTPSLEYVT